jgi:hypothetical protein
VENIKYNPNLFENSDVYVTEKLHGTQMIVGFSHSFNDNILSNSFESGKVIISSKGLFSKGMCFVDDVKNSSNCYVQMYKSMIVNSSWLEVLFNIVDDTLAFNFDDNAIIVYGELFGNGIQDLKYGKTDRDFKVFRICVYSNKGEYIRDLAINKKYRVPLLYSGKYDEDIINTYANGMSVFDNSQISEGVVVTDITSPNKRAKFINPKYLIRKGNITEFN